MDTKLIPAIIMLSAGSVSCIVTYLNHYSLSEMLVTLFIVLIVFLIIGLIVKKIFDSLHLPDGDAVSADGEVIEKSEEKNEDVNDINDIYEENVENQHISGNQDGGNS